MALCHFIPLRFLIRVSTLFLVGLAPSAHAQAPVYTITDLGTLGGSFHRTVGVNALGQVAGSISFGSGSQAFLSGPGGGSIVGLGTTGGSFSTGDGLNNLGQVSGTSQTATGGAHAFLSAAGGGPLKDIGVIPGKDDFSTGAGVNDQGQVTGYARVNGAAHAFLSAAGGGPLKDLGTLPASGSGLAFGPLDFDSEGVAVNNSGQVTGFSYDMRDSDSSDAHAFLSAANGGALKDLGTLGGSASRGLAVNDAGQVTGFAFTAASNSNATEHAFLSGANGGRLQDLGTLGGKFSAGSAVNNFGQVVGTADLVPDSQGRVFNTAFLYSAVKMVDLNTLIAPGSGLMIQDAVGISDSGYITGYAYNAADGQRHSYLLTPLPAVLTSLTFPSSVPGGTVVTATVSLNAVTYSDVVVGLSSSDPVTVRVFRSVIVPAGSSSATFAINTFRSHFNQMVTIRASLGSVVLTKDLTITGR